MPRSHKEVEILVVKLEQCMRDAQLWSSFPPSTTALQSVLPFACDTLSFEQWLQFVFIPKMFEITSTKGTLPHSLKLMPMLEQNLSSFQGTAVLSVIEQIDLVFTPS
jgi:uncharacterized protein YqcC (DUF446 family)